MRPPVVVAAVTMILLVGSSVAVSAALATQAGDDGTRAVVEVAPPPAAAPPAAPSPSPTPTPTLEPVPLLDAATQPDVDVDIDIDGFLAWAALDRTTGVRLSSPNATETSSTESMIKVWLVADHLRRATESGGKPSEEELRDARLAIRHSHNSAAQRLYEAGGGDATVERMIDICELADAHIPDGGSGWWSRTEMSARDAVRLGECVADGTAAGPQWTDWLLDEMRQVVGTTADEDQRPAEDFEGGRWGIIDGLPEELVEQGVSIKNGWTRIGRDSSWHLNCLAITDDWVMAVMMRYPAEYSLDYGAERCAGVARQLTDDLPTTEPP